MNYFTTKKRKHCYIEITFFLKKKVVVGVMKMMSKTLRDVDIMAEQKEQNGLHD